MQRNREDELEHGLSLISERGEVMPDQADEQLRTCYQDIQDVLRVPFVNFLFRVLANNPEFLIPAWRALRPRLTTRAFERAANELRAMAVLEADVPDATGVDWTALGDWDQMRRFTDTIHYVLPKLLLVATGFNEISQGCAIGVVGTPAADTIPLGVVEGTVKVPMFVPSQATGRLAELFEQIRQRHRHPGVASYYRALGHWPELLEALWQRVEPLVGSPAYEQRKRLLIQRAESLWNHLAGAAAVVKEPEADQATAIHSILAVFRRRLIPDLMLDVGLIEAMLGGTDAAKRSRFSAASEAR